MKLRTVVAALSVTMLLVACASGDGTPDVGGSGRVEGTVAVLAAASLTDVAADLAAAFEAAHPDVDVALTFDGSSRLASQIIEGVPGDVFLSADAATLDRVVQAGDVAGSPVALATSDLQIVVPAGNPKAIRGLRDLQTGVVVALCRPEVPCGAYAALAFRRAGLAAPAAGTEDSVRAVLAKVQLGEADAGLVYRTDVVGATGVTGVDLGPKEAVQATYVGAVLADASNPVAAAALVEFLRSEAGQAILTAAGFGRP